MPPRQESLGERLSGVEATLQAFEKYERERWHKLANDLQPLINLPTQMARDMGLLEGGLAGTVAQAVEKATKPVSDDVASLRADVDALKANSNQLSGAKMFGVWLVQTVVAASAALGFGKLLFGGP